MNLLFKNFTGSKNSFSKKICGKIEHILQRILNFLKNYCKISKFPVYGAKYVFLKIQGRFGGGAPEPPTIACPYKCLIFPIFKRFSERFAFFSIFPNNIANFLLILMQIFEKLPQILGLCPIVKFRSTLEKSDPPNIWRTPSNEKSGINYCIT